MDSEGGVHPCSDAYGCTQAVERAALWLFFPRSPHAKPDEVLTLLGYCLPRTTRGAHLKFKCLQFIKGSYFRCKRVLILLQN